jgi:hypothetical protein
MRFYWRDMATGYYKHGELSIDRGKFSVLVRAQMKEDRVPRWLLYISADYDEAGALAELSDGLLIDLVRAHYAGKT